MRMPKNDGTVTSNDVSESTKKRNTIIWENNSLTTDRTDKPARLCTVRQGTLWCKGIMCSRERIRVWGEERRKDEGKDQ